MPLDTFLYLERRDPEEPRWTGGQHYSLGHTGDDYTPTGSWTWVKDLLPRTWEALGLQLWPQIVVSASSAKSYGRRRHQYVWCASLSLGRVKIELDLPDLVPSTPLQRFDQESLNKNYWKRRKKAYSQREIKSEVDSLLLGNGERLASLLWERAMEPWRHSEVFTAEGAPFATKLNLCWQTEFGWPNGEYIIVDVEPGGRKFHRVVRTLWSVAGHFGGPAPDLTFEHWLPEWPR